MNSQRSLKEILEKPIKNLKKKLPFRKTIKRVTDATREELYIEERKVPRYSCEAITSILCCNFWLLNSLLGFYILAYESGELEAISPRLSIYVALYSLKWIILIFISWVLILSFLLLNLVLCCTS